MIILMYLSNGACVPVEGRIRPGLTENAFVKAWNKAQPGMVNKHVKVKYICDENNQVNSTKN